MTEYVLKSLSRKGPRLCGWCREMVYGSGHACQGFSAYRIGQVNHQHHAWQSMEVQLHSPASIDDLPNASNPTVPTRLLGGLPLAHTVSSASKDSECRFATSLVNAKRRATPTAR
jgi:hypothetical protein